MTTQNVIQLPYDYNLKVKQGSDRTIGVVFTQANGSPQNLTGYTSKLCVRQKIGGPVLLELTQTAGIVIDGPNGSVTVGFTHAMTSVFAFRAGVYDWYIASPATTPVFTYFLQGTFTVEPQVAA